MIQPANYRLELTPLASSAGRLHAGMKQRMTIGTSPPAGADRQSTSGNPLTYKTNPCPRQTRLKMGYTVSIQATTSIQSLLAVAERELRRNRQTSEFLQTQLPTASIANI